MFGRSTDNNNRPAVRSRVRKLSALRKGIARLAARAIYLPPRARDEFYCGYPRERMAVRSVIFHDDVLSARHVAFVRSLNGLTGGFQFRAN